MTTVTRADKDTAEFSSETEQSLEAAARQIFAGDLVSDIDEEMAAQTLESEPIPAPAPRRARGKVAEPVNTEPAPPAQPVFDIDKYRMRGLHRKLAEVSNIVKRIPKRGTAPGSMGGFSFVQVGDAAEPIRDALSERDVTLLPERMEILRESEHVTSRGGTMTTITILVTWRFTDGDSGETATIQSLGTGADTGDKFSPKAMTNSLKYALLMGFQLPTGDDPEMSDTSDRGARRNPGRDDEIVIGDSNVGPVRPGGRQGLVSEAQINEIGRLSRKLKLGPASIAAVIQGVLPNKPVPEFPPNSTNRDKQAVVLDHLSTLTSAEAATIVTTMIKATEEIDPDDES